MFGRKAKLPIDAVFQQATDENETTEMPKTDYIKELKERMEMKNQIVKDISDKARLKQKKYFDKKAKAATISVGDKVLVKILKFDGKHKIADKFEEELYKVTEQPRHDIPVFKVRSEISGVEKILHRNHLFPVQSQETTEEELDTDIIDASKGMEERIPVCENEHDDDNDDDSDSDIGYAVVSNTSDFGDAHNPLPLTEDHGIPNSGDKVDTENKGTDEEELESNEIEEVDDIEIQSVNSNHHEEHVDSDDTPIEIQTGIDNDTDDNSETSTEVTDENSHVDEGPGIEEIPEEPPPKSPPRTKPTPRRSVRERKPPNWQSDYHMNRMVPRPYDTNLQALDVLMNSGVLNRIDIHVAQKLLNTLSD
ncbi:zinc finger protein 652-B-like [Ruditapes philippinarum]|uniref:zinc finger protein 652-B-like n=1 Tax=Ruditapes philippinarum TaxID=129788 RepID=UPI00295BA869|nr:zinc finger protein 652-B-like [Ruditapes philippinarum]